MRVVVFWDDEFPFVDIPAITKKALSSAFNSTSVDVTYTYQPFISFWNFNALGIHLTIPTTTIHRRADFRLGRARPRR